MIVWIVFAIVTACVIFAIARPFSRAAADAPGAASELEAYKLQLAELSREEGRGEIGKEEAEQTRTEISRRLLKASRQGHSSSSLSGEAPLSANAAFFAIACVITIGSVTLYAIYGNPSLQDQPLEARLSAPPAEQPIGIQIANVERRLRENPKDALGWTVIAPVYFKTAQFDKAANAYRQAIKLSGPDEDKLLGLFEALTFAKEGEIPPEAKPILEAALARNPKSLRGRFWLAVLAGQDGNKADAERTYREMLSEDIPNSWKGLIQKQLAALTQESGAQEPTAAENPNAAPQGDQSAMIRGMVERLAARLKENGGDLDGWLKLIRSYAVLKEPAKAQEAAASARKQFASEPEALDKIDSLTRGLGLMPEDGKGGQPKS